MQGNGALHFQENEVRATQVMRDARATLARSAKRAVEAQKELRAVEPMFLMMISLIMFLFKDGKKTPYVWVRNDYQPTLTFMVEKLDSFKDPALIRAIETLAGFTGAELKSEDYPQSLNRDFLFDGQGYKVRLSAYADKDSASCKRVEIGRRTEEIVEYQLVCDDPQ